MTKFYFIFLILVLILSGCEKVIKVDLNDAYPNLVIEANLSDSPQLAEVKLTKTGSYFGSGQITYVPDATVYLEDEEGTRFNLSETETGVYFSKNIVPEIGKNYKLSVESEGKKYLAESTLNQPVKIDSLATEYNEGLSFYDKGYNINLYFHDPASVQNYYRLKIYVNNNLQDKEDNFILFDDENINGQFIQLRIRTKTYDLGDTVKYELISLDKGAYEYFSSVEEMISVNPGSAAPSNPISNISNGALGYFSAWSSSSKIIIVNE